MLGRDTVVHCVAGELMEARFPLVSHGCCESCLNRLKADAEAERAAALLPQIAAQESAYCVA